MGVLKFLFYLVLYVLIKIGDSVYAVLALLLRELRELIFSPVSLARNVKIPHLKFDLSRRKKRGRKSNKTIRYYLLRQEQYLRKFVILFVEELHQIRRFIVVVLIFIRNVLLYPLNLSKRLFLVRRRTKTKKHEEQVVITQYRIRFLSKLKYFIFGGTFSFIFFFIPAAFIIFISDLPKISNLSVNYIPKATKLLDRNGNLLFEIFSTQNRTIVPLEKIPKHLQQATIAIEDRDFYKHPGFDVRGITRALYMNARQGQLQGGSTITQQLIKSALLTPEPTLIRKSREIVLAFWAERKYSKAQILELYFNYVPYGGTAWGAQAASQVYFGKDVDKLSLAESSFLAGLPRAPSIYSPLLTDGSLGKKRQKEVLSAMVRDGYIAQKQASDAFAEKLVFLPPQMPIKAPHFVMYVKELLVRKYGLFEVERGGLQVVTTLDVDMQKMAEEIVTDEVERSQSLGIGNGAAVITNPQTGDILAMVGSKDYFDQNYDGNVNIVTSLRQPGSTIKVVTYALALSNGFTEATILDDLPLTIHYPGGPSYTPVNYDGAFHGRVPLRIALANSFNIPAVRLAQKLGVDEIVRFGKEMGISSWKTNNNYGVSITLGGAEVTMLDLATVYGTVANEGKRVEANPILEVRDSQGKVLQRKEVVEKAVLSPGVAFILSDILADNRARSWEFGANSPLQIPNHRVSVKTGTTDNKRDNWTVGFTNDYVVAAWVGNNDNTPLSQALASGITGAAPIWNQIMTNLLTDTLQEPQQVPSDVVLKKCLGYDAYFVRGTEEKIPCRAAYPSPTFQQQ